ncbi:MAG: HAD family phosphatase [Clostridiales bacterium]
MKISGAIFDMDGTLVDSMPIWHNVAENYLRARQITPPAGLLEQFHTLSLEQMAICFHQQLGIADTPPEIVAQIYQMLDHGYRYTVPLKPGVEEFLTKLQQQGAPMAVATATDRPMVELVLKRLKIWGFFDFVLTCSEVGVGKVKPDIFEQALALLGTEKQQTPVFEDAYYAIATAKMAGFPVIAIADPTAIKDKEKIMALADIYVANYADFVG